MPLDIRTKADKMRDVAAAATAAPAERAKATQWLKDHGEPLTAPARPSPPPYQQYGQAARPTSNRGSSQWSGFTEAMWREFVRDMGMGGGAHTTGDYDAWRAEYAREQKAQESERVRRSGMSDEQKRAEDEAAERREREELRRRQFDRHASGDPRIFTDQYFRDEFAAGFEEEMNAYYGGPLRRPVAPLPKMTTAETDALRRREARMKDDLDAAKAKAKEDAKTARESARAAQEAERALHEAAREANRAEREDRTRAYVEETDENGDPVVTRRWGRAGFATDGDV